MLKTIKTLIQEVTPYWAEVLADYLIKNGMVIPVRCKDCKHCAWDEFYGFYCTNISKFVEPDFWCANGERKDNGKEQLR